MFGNHAKLLTVAACIALLSACATGPKYQESAASVPKLRATEGRIYVYRSSGLGGLVQPSVYLNGTEVGSAVPMTVFFVDRTPGSYEVSASTEVEKKVTFSLAQGEQKYVRFTPTFGLIVGRIVPELVDQSTAEAELKELSLVAAKTK